ncbi:hypothetical protein [Sulfurovum sp.]|uniref:hypothetical protein n=1 Tax=Sulfurovum sp. TaxID=1969726 RepID=UPI003568D372
MSEEKTQNIFMYHWMKEMLSSSFDDLRDLNYEEVKRRYDEMAEERKKVRAIESRNGDIVFFVVLLGIVAFFYWIGLYYTSLVLLGFAALSVVFVMIDEKISKPGDFTSWGILPFSFFLIAVGSVMYYFATPPTAPLF